MQTQYAFDRETVRKMGISFLLGVCSGLGAFGIAYSETANFRASLLIGLGAFAGFVVNAIKEFIKGEPHEIEAMKLGESEESEE